MTEDITTLDKVKFGTSSIFSKVCVHEKVDPRLLFNIIYTADLIKFDKKRYEGGVGTLYKTERDLLLAYQYQWVNCINTFVSEWYLPKHGWGRLQPKNYLSMSVFHRPTRHTLCNEHLIDIDLVNCHFEIVLDFMKQMNLQDEYIQKYCNNVSFYRQEIMKFYNVSKDVAKALFIRVIYGGSIYGWKKEHNISNFKDHDIVTDIALELQDFMDIVWDTNQHIYEDIVTDTPNYYNNCNLTDKKRSVMAFWCQSLERYIQEQSILYLVNTHKLNISQFIPCQDGFMMRKDHYKPEFIEEINTFLKTELKLVSRFIQKPFNEIYKVGTPGITHIYKPFCLQDAEDAQFAQLLIDVGFKYNDIITTGDSKCLESYMYNGIYWERLALHNAEFQKGRFDFLEDWCMKKIEMLRRVLKSESNTPDGGVVLTMRDMSDLKYARKELSKKLTKMKKDRETSQETITLTENTLRVMSLLIDIEVVLSKGRAKVLTLSRNSTRNSIIDLFLGKLHKSEIKWDSNPELFACNNVIIDLTTQQPITPCKEQYIRTTCGWDWDLDYDNSKVEIIRALITSILPIVTVCEYFLTYMSVGLSGNRVQRILINTGTGGNGKSLLRELFNQVLGKYSMKLPTEIICSSIKASGANPVIASMDGKRNVYFSEPDSRQKLCTATVKELTGDATLVGRHLYSAETQVKLVATISGDCNALPLFDTVDPDAKDSLVRRLSIVPFITRAVSQKEYDESDDKTHLNIKQNYAENASWMNDHKQAYFLILLDYYQKYKNIPNVLDILPTECSDRASLHLNASCNIMAWIEAQLVKVDNIETSEPIPLKSLYDRFKTDDTFRTYSKQDQRKYSMKYFLNLIMTAKEMRGFIKLRSEYHNKERLTVDHLVGYRYVDEEVNTDTSNL